MPKLTSRQIHLVQHLISTDMDATTRHLIAGILRDDTSKEHETLVERLTKKLERDEMTRPQFNDTLLYVENVSEFCEDRYFLSEREEALFQHIVKMRSVAGKMSGMGIRYLNASLLYGESGTGKTMFGRFLAHKLDLPFVYINLSFVISSLLGGTAQNLCAIFSDIKRHSCVFMLDELDCIGVERGKTNTGDADKERNNMTISLIQLLDRVLSDVVILAATNRKDIIDSALLRRFPVKHEVTRLTRNERIALYKNFLASLSLGIPSVAKEEIMRMAEQDCTQADLNVMLTEKIADVLLTENN